MKRICLAVILACTGLLASEAVADDPAQQASADGDKPVNATCPISKEPIVPSAGTFEHKGHVVGVCCSGCGRSFMAWDEKRKDEFVALAMMPDNPEALAKQDEDSAASQPEKIQSDPYLLDTCPVSGQKLGSMGDPIVKMIDGREIKFCCGGCVGQFEENKAKFFAQIDEKMIEQQLPFYPLTTCVVMDEEQLGETGEPINHIYKNRLVRFCCKMCKKDFEKDPKAYLAKLDKAVIEQQSAHYPLDTCAVMETSKLGSMGEPVKIVVANRLVQFCCGGCQDAFDKNPAKYIERINNAWKEHGHMPGVAAAPHDNDRGKNKDDHDHGSHDHGAHGDHDHN